MDLIGAMYHTVEVLVNSGGTLGAGGDDNYTTLLTTRGSLRASSGSRNNAFAVIEGGNSWTIITRYQDTIWNALRMSTKLQIDGVRYTMQSWERVNDNRRAYIRFNVTTNTN